MDKREFLRWRRALGYTQEEAAEKLGVVRGTINNWERGVARIPQAVELACHELTRRWKQRPDFGPVSLVYADNQTSTCRQHMYCELFSNNDLAIKQALKLHESLFNPLIIEDGGAVVWSAWELLRECEIRRNELNPTRASPKPGPKPGTNNAVPPSSKTK
jgi:DNA-binding XRE family transcriptional regulator